MDYKLALMTGIDIPIPELQLCIHQPTIKEISFIGEQEFFVGLQTLLVNKNMLQSDNSLLESTTNFQIFMTIMGEKQAKDKKQSVLALLQILFSSDQVIFTPRTVIIKYQENTVIIDNENFNILQGYLKDIFCINSGTQDQMTFNPADKKAKEIADKLMRGRQRVAEQKGETNSSALTRYASILTVGLNTMPLSEIINLTMYQLYDLVERYSLYLNWDLDIKARLAGGGSDSKPEDWMKNIH